MNWCCWPRSETPAPKKPSRIARAGSAVLAVPRKVVGGAVSVVTAPFRGKPKQPPAAPQATRRPDARGTHFARYYAGGDF